jgi:hypothetical protein
LLTARLHAGSIQRLWKMHPSLRGPWQQMAHGFTESSDPCPVRSSVFGLVFTLQLPPALKPMSHHRTAWSHGQLAREALGARLAENSAINGRISLHGHQVTIDGGMGGPLSTLSNIAGTLFPAALDLLLVPGRWTVGAIELLRPGFPARRPATIGPRELQGKPFAPTTNALRGSQVPKLPLPSLPTWRSHLIASWKGNLADGPWTLLYEVRCHRPRAQGRL